MINLPGLHARITASTDDFNRTLDQARGKLDRFSTLAEANSGSEALASS